MWPGWCSWRRASGRPRTGKSHQFPQGTWRTKITAQSTWMAWRPMYSLLSDVLMGPYKPWEERGQLGQAPLIHLSKVVHQLTVLRCFGRYEENLLFGKPSPPGHLIREKCPVSHQREKKSDSLWNSRLSSHHNDMRVWVTALMKLISIWYLRFMWVYFFVCVQHGQKMTVVFIYFIPVCLCHMWDETGLS